MNFTSLTSIFLAVKYKDGKPSDAQLLELSIRVASKWERIGLLLGLSQDQIDDIKVNKDDKAYSMLLEWRNITTSPIPYKVLYDVLCHKTVRLDVVAREFCLSQTRWTNWRWVARLGRNIGKDWESLGGCTRFLLAELQEIDLGKKLLSQKACHMLQKWKQKNGHDATYQNL